LGHRGGGLLGEGDPREPGALDTPVIRQLARLTRRVPEAGPRALALQVYADEADIGLAARERGFEGVACVDDAARAVVLLLDLYRDTGDRRLGQWATGLVDFVLYMQLDDGRFHNFIRDWDATINTDGPISYAVFFLKKIKHQETTQESTRRELDGRCE